jgi:biopolymer transport protein ExbD
MSLRRHRQFEDDTELDMTPMLDVVFILLIFFIVTTSFVKEAGITINTPRRRPQCVRNRRIYLLQSSQMGRSGSIIVRLMYGQSGR